VATQASIRGGSERGSIWQRLTVSQRQLLITVAFTLPLGTMVTLIDLGKDITFARHELDGNAYQRRLVAAFQAVSDHQRLTDAASRTPAAAADRQAARERGDAAFAALQQIDAAVGASLQFTPDGLKQRKREHVALATVSREWAEARDGADVTKHAHVLADLRTMTAHAGDVSNLILDPDLDSYYVMDMTLLALPQTQDRTAALLLQLQQLGAHPRLTIDQQRQLAVTSAFLREADRDRLTADADTALNEDQNFYAVSPGLQATLRPAVDRYATATTAFVAALDALTQAKGKVDPGPAIVAGLASREASFALWRAAAAELDTLLDTRIRYYEQARWRALGVTGVAWAGALAIVFLIGRSITRPLAAASHELARTARQVQVTASHVSASAQSLSQGATEQAASIEETSASMEEMGSMTSQTAEQSAQAAALVEAVARQVERSNAALSGMVAAMSAIRESSGQVGRIIKTIDEIAFQTNILALNAAVEAARAGGAGLGFAVVADEVRTLAQRSARAAHDTAGLIEAAIARTGEGADKVGEVTEMIASITGTISELEALMAQVHEASTQQSQGIAQVASAVVQMERVTQATAATAEETAATSEELNAQAEMSMVQVGRLAALVGSAGTTVRDTQPRRAQVSRHPAATPSRTERPALRRAS
jgi:methyl-accepting chemotaxis protein